EIDLADTAPVGDAAVVDKVVDTSPELQGPLDDLAPGTFRRHVVLDRIDLEPALGELAGDRLDLGIHIRGEYRHPVCCQGPDRGQALAARGTRDDSDGRHRAAPSPAVRPLTAPQPRPPP